jgi:sugar lactone lactonase YvrE
MVRLNRSLLLIAVVVILNSNLFAQQVSTFINANSGISDGLAVDSQGNLYGGNWFEGEVYKVTPSGEVTLLADGYENVNGITVDEDDNLYFSATGDSAIFRITPDGTVSQYGPSMMTQPNGLIFDPESDTLYVSSYLGNEILKLAPDGTLITWISGGELAGPLGITFDDENRLYIANFDDGKIFRVEGNSLVHLATVPYNNEFFACGFVTYSGGYLYATGIGVNQVFRITLDGEISIFAGSGAQGSSDGDALSATFHMPNGIIPDASGETIYISEFEPESIRTITGFTSDVNWEPLETPQKFSIQQNYPNPFNPSTTIPFSLNQSGVVHIAVYDILGQRVATLYNGLKESGEHKAKWNGLTDSGKQNASGVYLVRFESQGQLLSQRITLLK